MLRLTALSLVLASLASAADVNDLEACDGGDLEACRRAAHRAERKREFTLARELRQRAQALEKPSEVKESAASAPEPAARASETEDLGLARTVPLVEAVPTWPAEGMEPLLALPESGVPPEPPLAAPDTSPPLAVPPPRLEPVSGTEVRSEHVEAPSHHGSFASRLGFLAVGGSEVLTSGVATKSFEGSGQDAVADFEKVTTKGNGRITELYDEAHWPDTLARGPGGQKYASNFAILADGSVHAVPASHRSKGDPGLILTTASLGRGKQMLFNGHLHMENGVVNYVGMSGRLGKLKEDGTKFADPVAILKAWGFQVTPGLTVTQE